MNIDYYYTNKNLNISTGPFETGTTVTVNYHDFPPKSSSWFWLVVMPYSKSAVYNPLAGGGRLDYSDYIYGSGSWSTTLNKEGDFAIFIAQNPFNVIFQGAIFFKIVKKKLSLDNIVTAKEAVHISPNPTNGLFKIATAETISEIQIHDQMGKCILKTASNSIDITAQPNGIYFATIQDKNSNVVKRKIIKK
jgi:hypothetical protein